MIERFPYLLLVDYFAVEGVRAVINNNFQLQPFAHSVPNETNLELIIKSKKIE